MKPVVLALLIAAAALPANGAQPAALMPPAACPAVPALPSELAGWAHSAASDTLDRYDAEGQAKSPVLGGVRTTLSLHPSGNLHYWLAPERALDAAKFGGMMPIEVAKPGRLVVALGAGAWIDLVRDGVALKSLAHGHGPDCSGIRKIVEYDVTPGRYLLQISGAPTPSIGAMASMRD